MTRSRRTRTRLTPAVLGALMAVAPACVPGRPLGAPVPTAESRASRAELAALLLSSGRYDEAAREYAYLLSISGGATSYRLGLAKALAWGGRHRDAEHHLRVLRSSRPGDAEVARLLRSARANLRPSVDEARRWVAEQPGYRPYRLALARAYASAGRHDEALREYDRVVRGSSGTDGLVERAGVHMRRGDLDAAERDIRRAIRIDADAAAWLALGEVQRRRGDAAAARESYRSAQWEEPGSLEVRAAFAQLARDERPPLVSVAVPGQERGWELAASALRDNADIRYARVGGRRGFRPGGPFTASAGVELRDLREETPEERYSSMGVAGDVALAVSGVRGNLFGALGGSVGGVRHEGETLTMAEAVARVGYRTWVVGAELATGPAYPTLMTGASLLRPDRRLDALSHDRVRVLAGGPIGRADAALIWERAEISDGNVRSSFTVSTRYPLSRRVSALYTGNGIAFADRSARYWDPDDYLGNAVGLEVADRRLRGFSYAARAHAGVAVTAELPFQRAGVQRDGRDTFLQLDVGGQVGYRGERWELGATYGFGGVSDYHRHEASFTLRLSP